MVSVLSSDASNWWSAGEIALAGCPGVSFCELTWLLFSGPSTKGWSTVKRRVAAGAADQVAGPCHFAPMETLLFKQLPNIMSHLCVCRYEDGGPRRPGRMFIETSGAFFKVVVKEPDDGLEMLLSAPTIDDVLALADLMLAADRAPWAPDPFARKQGGKGGKK